MNTTSAIVLGIVVLALIGAGIYVYQSSYGARPTAGQQIGMGVGNLVSGILGAAGVA